MAVLEPIQVLDKLAFKFAGCATTSWWVPSPVLPFAALLVLCVIWLILHLLFCFGASIWSIPSSFHDIPILWGYLVFFQHVFIYSFVYLLQSSVCWSHISSREFSASEILSFSLTHTCAYKQPTTHSFCFIIIFSLVPKSSRFYSWSELYVVWMLRLSI